MEKSGLEKILFRLCATRGAFSNFIKNFNHFATDPSLPLYFAAGSLCIKAVQFV